MSYVKVQGVDVESSLFELALELDESLVLDESLELDGDDDDDELELDGEVELADHDLNSVSLRYPSLFVSTVRNPLFSWLFERASVVDTRPSPFASIPLKLSIPLELVELELLLVVVPSAEASVAAPASTKPIISCLIISFTSKSIGSRSHGFNCRLQILSAASHCSRRHGRTRRRRREAEVLRPRVRGRAS
jgi:hypothetical protein